MDELVERLRYGRDVESWWVLGSEAADEIERLRTALAQLEDFARRSGFYTQAEIARAAIDG